MFLVLAGGLGILPGQSPRIIWTDYSAFGPSMTISPSGNCLASLAWADTNGGDPSIRLLNLNTTDEVRRVQYPSNFSVLALRCLDDALWMSQWDRIGHTKLIRTDLETLEQTTVLETGSETPFGVIRSPGMIIIDEVNPEKKYLRLDFADRRAIFVRMEADGTLTKILDADMIGIWGLNTSLWVSGDRLLTIAIPKSHPSGGPQSIMQVNLRDLSTTRLLTYGRARFDGRKIAACGFDCVFAGTLVNITTGESVSGAPFPQVTQGGMSHVLYVPPGKILPEGVFEQDMLTEVMRMPLVQSFPPPAYVTTSIELAQGGTWGGQIVQTFRRDNGDLVSGMFLNGTPFFLHGDTVAGEKIDIVAFGMASSRDVIVSSVRQDIGGGAYRNGFAVIPYTAPTITNGASFNPGIISPLQVASLFGTNIGPTETVVADLASGTLPLELGGYSVIINGRPAPLLFGSKNQFNVVIQEDLPLGNATVEIHRSGKFFGLSADVEVNETNPGVFMLDSARQAAVLNEGGSINGRDNPAPRGSIIAIFMTGGGLVTPALKAGTVTPPILTQTVAPVSVTICGKNANILYAGGAPGLIAGVNQINVRVPADVQAGACELRVTVGGVTSPPTKIEVR